METAARLDKLQLDWPEAALPRRAGVIGRSVFTATSVRGFALHGDRRPSFERFLSCLAHPREVIRAGRQKPDVCRCAAVIKKEHISSSTVSTTNYSNKKPTWKLQPFGGCLDCCGRCSTKIVWLSYRGIKSQNCISVKSLILLHCSVGRRISLPKYVLVQVVLRMLCCRSEKWSEDCACSEKDHLKSVLHMEDQPGRAKRSNTGQISSRKTDCLHDLRTFSSYWCS